MHLMKSYRHVRTVRRVLSRVALLTLLTTAAALSALQPLQAATNIVLWDTSSTLAVPLNVEDRSAWKQVPNDLLVLEADPPKASSDPGYYGREYTFQGDAVVDE